VRQAFGLKSDDVTINRPFAGGYITRTYGRKPIPWIQVELNRTFYLTPEFFDPVTSTIDPNRLSQLREMMAATLRMFSAG